jgi:Tfp pilus assembly protein PilF
MGKLGEARAHFERALQLDPQQPIAKQNLEDLEKEGSGH